MAAIFPPENMGGVPPGPGVANGYIPAHTVIGGGPFYIASDCSTMLTDSQMNSISSEFLAAVDRMGYSFNTNLVTNLGDALIARFDLKLDAAGGAVTGPIILPGAPTAPNHAATKQYVDDGDALKVSKSGDTMTGPLVVPVIPGAPEHAASKAYVDAAIVSMPEAPVDTFAYGRMGAAWTQVLQLTGGQLTGPLILHGDPTLPLEAVPKQYADTKIGDAPTDGQTYARLNNGWTPISAGGPSYMPVTGGVFTGNVTISKLQPALNLSSTATNDPAFVHYQRNGTDRWLAEMNADPEGGANAGANYALTRCDDAGARIDSPLVIDRASGVAKFKSVWINDPAPTFRIYKNPGNDAAISGFNRIDNKRRWRLVLGDSTAEAGSNAGSDFRIDAYSDADSQLTTPLLIARATGTATFNAPSLTLKAPAANNAQLVVDSPGATYVGEILFKKNTVGRWSMRGIGNAARDDFQIFSYSDAGAINQNSFTIRRTDGLVGIGPYTGGAGAVSFFGNSECQINTYWGHIGITFWGRSATGGSGAGNYACSFNNYVGTQVGVIGISDYSTVYAESSDIRLKENNVPFERGREIIDALAVQEFDWKDGGGHAVGLMAQELEPVLPQAVVKGTGEPGETGFTPWSVDYSKCVPALIQALQDAMRRIDQLEEQVATLTSRIHVQQRGET
jgi:hypothetical protein